MSLPIEDQLQIRELELNNLFEIIRAINSNVTEENLYRIYKLTLNSNPALEKLVLLVHTEEGNWAAKVAFGGIQLEEGQLFDNEQLDPFIHEGDEPQAAPQLFSEFDSLVPITHKEKALAVVLVGKSKHLTAENSLNLSFIRTLSNIILVAVENKKLARKEKRQEALRRQLEIAKDVQNLLFPKELPYSDKLKVAASYHPHHTVGGDYYDFIPIGDDRFLLCVADVSGKGVPAAILMSNFQAALRVLVRHTNDLRVIVEELNTLIIQNSGGGSFITAFFAIYNFTTCSLSYINAGHNPPFLFRGEELQHLAEGTTVIGGFDPLPFLHVATLNNLNRFMLFCFTDGFTETYNEEGEELGEEKLGQYIQSKPKLDPDDLHADLLNFLNRYKGESKLADDVTLISCRIDN